MTADLGVHGSSVTLPGGFRDVGFGSQDSCCLFAALCSVVVRGLVFLFPGGWFRALECFEALCIEAIASLDTGRAMLLLHYVADRRVGPVQGQGLRV